MSALLDGVLRLRPLVTGFTAGAGGSATATLALPRARAKDLDVLFDGERVAGVHNVKLHGKTVEDSMPTVIAVVGEMRVRRFSREWAASDTPIELSIVVRDPADGREVARLPFGRVTLGEPVSVDAKYIDVPLLVVPT